MLFVLIVFNLAASRSFASFEPVVHYLGIFPLKEIHASRVYPEHHMVVTDEHFYTEIQDYLEDCHDEFVSEIRKMGKNQMLKIEIGEEKNLYLVMIKSKKRVYQMIADKYVSGERLISIQKHCDGIDTFNIDSSEGLYELCLGASSNNKKENRINHDIDNLKAKMHSNISIALENIECCEKLLAMSEELKTSASVFKRKARKLKRRFYCSQFQRKSALGLAVGGACVAGTVSFFSVCHPCILPVAFKIAAFKAPCHMYST